MKLLTPKEIKDRKAQETARDLIRVKETDEVVRKVNIRLANAEADFETALARHKRQWAEEEIQHSKRVEEMEKEVKELEDKKRQALIPIDLYKDQADALFKEATSALSVVKEKERIIEETQDRLEEKLDAVGEREQTLQKDEEKWLIKKQGIEQQAADVETGIEKLTAEMASFYEKKTKDEESLAIRKREAEIAEISVVTKLDKLRRENADLKEYERKLKDERGVLDRAWKELRELQAKYPPIKSGDSV